MLPRFRRAAAVFSHTRHFNSIFILRAAAAFILAATDGARRALPAADQRLLLFISSTHRFASPSFRSRHHLSPATGDVSHFIRFFFAAYKLI